MKSINLKLICFLAACALCDVDTTNAQCALLNAAGKAIHCVTTVNDKLVVFDTVDFSGVGIVPAGYYRRIRSVITAGTPTFTYNSGQEIQI